MTVIKGVVLGIDCGGTSTQCVILDDTGRIVAQGQAGPSNPLSVGVPLAEAAVKDAVEQGLRDLPEEVAVLGVHVGAADEDFSAASPHLAFLQHYGKVTLSSDVLTAWAGASLLQPGAVLVAGTGSIAAAVDEHLNMKRFGGWGHILGDEGSAYWIGLQAIRCLLQRWERQEKLYGLPGRVAESMNWQDPNDVWPWVYQPILPRQEIASLAALVDTAANEGDGEGQAILDLAAQQLASLACQVLKVIDSQQLWYSGGVFHSHYLRKAFAEGIRVFYPAAEISAPRSSGAVGAALLAWNDHGGVLDSNFVSVLRRSIEEVTADEQH